jgi:hypothetical protein
MTEYIVNAAGAGQYANGVVFTPTEDEEPLIDGWLAQAAISEYTAPEASPYTPPAQDAFFAAQGQYAVWDGTNWLGPEYTLPFIPYDPLTVPPYAADASPLYAILPTTKALKLVGADFTTGVATTNGEEDYWTVGLYRQPAAASAELLCQFLTDEDDVGVIASHPITEFDVTHTTTGDRYVYLTIQKEGAPGNLAVGLSLVVRDVIA